MNTLGVILVGGQSRRMGQDKWSLTRPDGRSWLQFSMDLVTPHVEEILISTSSPLSPNIDPATCLVDEQPGEGPLGAWATLAHHYPAVSVLSLPCDMPQLTSQEVSLLPGPVSGYLQGAEVSAPLAAWLTPETLQQARQAFLQGERSVMRFWASVDHLPRQVATDFSLKNANSPEDIPKNMGL